MVQDQFLLSRNCCTVNQETDMDPVQPEQVQNYIGHQHQAVIIDCEKSTVFSAKPFSKTVC